MRFGFAFVALTAVLAGCDSGPESTANGQAPGAAGGVSSPTLTAALSSSGDLATTARLVKAAGLESALGRGSYTLFAPTDAALEALPADQIKALESPEGRPQLIALLRQHIATGQVLRADLDKGLAGGGQVSLASMGAQPIVARKTGDAIAIGAGGETIRLTGEPIMAGNGVVYRIDGLIPPPPATGG